MTLTETRILSLSDNDSDYAIVSMPLTAWYWLDDLVKDQYPGGYPAVVKDFKDADDAKQLSFNLRICAQEHCARRMTCLYNLSNDNMPEGGYNQLKPSPSNPFSPDISRTMPSVYRLFHFMPHATYLTTVWERRNYHSNKPKTCE